MYNPSIAEVDPSALPHRSRRNTNVSIESSFPTRAHTRNSYLEDTFQENHLKPHITRKKGIVPLELHQETVSYDSENESDEPESDENIYPKDGWRRYSIVAGSFLNCFTLFGIMNSMGAIESYIQSNQLANISVTSVSWVFSIYMFVTLFMGLIVGPIYDTYGTLYLLSTGSILVFLGLFTCGSATSLYQFILSFGICAGIGTGYSMFPAISVISSWFDRTERSFYIGVVQAGGSIGGIFFPILLRYLFEHYGFTWALRIFALFNLGVTAVGTLLTKDRLHEIKELTNEPDDERSFIEKLKSSIDINACKDKQFLALTAALFMNEFSLLIVLTYLASYAIAYGASPSESYVMLAILNLCGTFGKFIPSYFSQKYGCFNMMILMSCSMTIECFIIWLPFGKYRSALYVFIVLYGFAYAATYSLTGATVGRITKKTKDFGKRYGSAYAIVSFGNLISLPISGSFIVTKSTTDYDHMVAFAAATCCLASVLFIYSRYTVVGSKLWVSV